MMVGMIRSRCLPCDARHVAVLACVLFLLAPLLRAQADAATRPGHDPSVDLRVPDGLAVTLAAESPLLFNPTAMDVDAAGRLWITEAVNYRKWGGRNPGLDHPDGDRVVVLSDDDGDGEYDRSTVFVQEQRLVAPLGIAVFGSTVVVSCSPDLIVYHDDDGDLLADRSEVLLTGFGGHDHDHGLHSVVAGPDCRWYFAVGNAGPHIVTDRSGWTLRSGSLYTGGGEHLADNKPGLVSDDGRVWVGGLICSVNPDGTDLRVHAHNFRNEYEVALDAFGRMYSADNDDDGNRGCRTTWVMEGGNYGYFSADGSRYWSADRRPGQDTPTAHWHQDDPGVMPAGTINGAGGPTGVAVYEGALMAPWIDGAVLNADAGAGRVYAHRPREVGAGVVLDPGVLLWARDDDTERGARWFRPSDVCVAPDGSVLVADWYDPGVGGHAAGDAAAYGRILRVAPTGHRVSVPPIDTSTIEGAIAALGSPAVNVRQLGREALAERRDEAVDALLAMVSSADPRRRALATGVAAAFPVDGVPMALLDREGEDDVRVTAAAMRAARWLGLPVRTQMALMGYRTAPLETQSVVVENRTSPPLQREFAITLAQGNAGRAGSVWGQTSHVGFWRRLFEKYQGGDRYALEALGLAALGIGDLLWTDVVSHNKFGGTKSGPGAWWSPREADLAWRLHPAAAIPGLAARANSTSLPQAERRRMIDALGFCPEREAAEAMVALALSGPEDTRELARFWVEQGESGLWAEHGLGLPTLGGSLAQTTLAWSSGGVAHDEVFDVDVDVTGAESLWVVVGDGGNGNSCDWAVLVEPTLHTLGGPVSLSAQQPLVGEIAWGRLGFGVDCEGGTLTVGGRPVTDGIGTHAPSLLAWELPPGATRFTARLAAEDTGLSQGDPSPTSITWEVRVLTPPDRSALRALEEVLRDNRADDDAREEAAVALAEDPEGGLVLIDLARQGVLDDGLRAVVGEVIYAHPDPTVRALAHGLFPRPGELHPLPPLDELLALRGDPSRGRQVFRSSTAQCSTCHRVRGRGGDVGPDLSDVATKLDRSALLDAILNPSASIAHGFDGWLITTADGQRLTGFVQADGERLLFKDSAGKRHLLAADDVVDRYPLSLSIMPEGVALGLEPPQLADLLAFLGEDRRPPGAPGAADRLGEPVVLFDGTSLDAWEAFLPGGEDPAATWSIVDGELRCEGQPIGYLKTRESWTDFVFELDWRFLPEREPGNSGVLLRLNGDDKVWPRSFEAQLHHRNAGDIWNIDAMDVVVDAARTQGRRTLKRLPCNEKPLGEWNHYRITLHRDRLTLEVNGELQNTADWCEERDGPLALQAEGAPIAFRNVVLTPILR